MSKHHRYSEKEHRQVEHIQASEERAGHSPEEARAIGYATVNTLDPQNHRYTAKEHRQAGHIIESEERAGKSEIEAKSIAYATVNKHAGSRG